MRYLSLVVMMGMLTACAPLPGDYLAEMEKQSTALRRLSAAVEGELWLAGDDTPGDDLLARVCSKDPSLCAHFKDNQLRAEVRDGYAVVLVCSPDGQQALIEDVACTPQPDSKRWDDTTARCEFTLHPQEYCE